MPPFSIWALPPPGNAGVPPAPYLARHGQSPGATHPGTPPFQAACVKDECGLSQEITPPLRGSRRSQAEWRRLMRWGADAGITRVLEGGSVA